MEYSLCKTGEPQTFNSLTKKRESAIREIFQKSFSEGNFGVTIYVIFHVLCIDDNPEILLIKACSSEHLIIFSDIQVECFCFKHAFKRMKM